jgi:hypothetical protein
LVAYAGRSGSRRIGSVPRPQGCRWHAVLLSPPKGSSGRAALHPLPENLCWTMSFPFRPGP